MLHLNVIRIVALTSYNFSTVWVESCIEGKWEFALDRTTQKVAIHLPEDQLVCFIQNADLSHFFGELSVLYGLSVLYLYKILKLFRNFKSSIVSK